MNLDLWNFVIAVLALVAAIYAIIYTHIQNKIIVDVIDGYFDQQNDSPFLIHFFIQNLSSKPLKIIDVKILDNNNQQIKTLEKYIPKINSFLEADSTYWEQKPFTKPENLYPGSDSSFSYYLYSLETHLNISVTVQSFSFYKKKKTFKLPIVLKKND